MSIRKKRGSFGEEFAPVCDGCSAVLRSEQAVWDHSGDVFDDPFYEFDDAVEAKKEAGWKSRKIGDDWFDFCPACFEHYYPTIKARSTAANDFRGIGRA